MIGIWIFVAFNVVAVLSVFFSHRVKLKTELTRHRHYTILIFNVCGILYALFLGFIIWDVWERFYDVRKDIQEEAKQLTELYRDSQVFPEQGEEGIQAAIRAYLDHTLSNDWQVSSTQAGDVYVNAIWNAYYKYKPTDDWERIWYSEALDKLSRFSDARLTRTFNLESSLGPLRWALLIFGGLILISIPCFFEVEDFVFKLILTLFLANIVAFMLFIAHSLDHPFSGYHKIAPYPYEYALEVTKNW